MTSFYSEEELKGLGFKSMNAGIPFKKIKDRKQDILELESQLIKENEI